MNLAELVYPIDAKVFLEDYWERRPLLIADRGAPYYNEVFSLKDVDRLLTGGMLHPSDVRAVNNGKDVSRQNVRWSGGRADPPWVDALLAQYRSGSTLVLQFLQNVWPSLRILCSMLAREFSAAFQVNAYLTPPKSQGLSVHYDTHDVFVLQLEGRKHWTVYDAPIALPLKHQKSNATVHPGRVTQDGVLRPGDLLYLPRGYLHRAVSLNEASLHLTVGINSITWGEVILAAVEACVEADPQLRTSLPAGFADGGESNAVVSDRFATLVRTVLDTVDTSAAIADATERALLAQRAMQPGRLLDVEYERRIEGDTRVRRREDVECRIAVQANDLVMRFNGKLVTMPSFASEEVHHLAQGEECCASELPGNVDLAGRVVLIRRLVREGLLTVVR